MNEPERTETPKLTIVGGQPVPHKNSTDDPDIEVPVGVEMLLYRAARNPQFKQQLLDDRAGAIADSGVRLRASERAALQNVSPQVLCNMIERLRPANLRGRRFMTKVAAAVTSLAAGTAMATSISSCGGARPDSEIDGGGGQGGSGGGGGTSTDSQPSGGQGGTGGG
jgi:hypothetical protein